MRTSNQILAEGWVQIAADQLSSPAKERVQLEIQSHFDEAVESHQSEGASEAESQARALEDLGDPKAAGKRFRKSHLTESEANYLGGLLKFHGDLGQNVWLATLFYGSSLVVIARGWFALAKTRYPVTRTALSLIISLALYPLMSWLARRRGSRSLRVLVALDYGAFYAPLAILVCLRDFAGLVTTLVLLFLLVLVAVSGVLIGRETRSLLAFRLMFKLPRIGDVRSEIPANPVPTFGFGWWVRKPSCRAGNPRT